MCDCCDVVVLFQLNVLLDNRLLRQLGLKDEQDIIVKKLSSTTLASLSGRNGVEEVCTHARTHTHTRTQLVLYQAL